MVKNLKNVQLVDGINGVLSSSYCNKILSLIGFSSDPNLIKNWYRVTELIKLLTKTQKRDSSYYRKIM